jgi:HK97 family phage major capsid protein
MSKITEIIAEERARAWEEAKALLDAATAENRDLTAEESQTFSRINADLDEKDQRIKTIADAEQRAAAIESDRRTVGVAADLGGASKAEVDDDAMIRSMLRGERRAATFERRTVTKSSATLVPTSVYSRIVEHLVQGNPVRGLATVVNTTTGESLVIPKSTAFSTASIVGEGSQASASDPTLASTSLGAYKYVVLVQMSNELANDNAVDVAGFLARQAGIAIGVATRGHMTTGDGSSKPYGIATRATTGVTGAAAVAGVFTADNLIDLRYSVNGVYTAQPGNAWMMNSTAMSNARKLKDSQNRYLFEPGLNGNVDNLLGFPVYINDSVATPAAGAKSVVFGHIPSYFIREVNGIEVAVSDDFAFDYSVRTFRVTLRTDADLVDQTGAVKCFVGGAAS